MRRIRSMVSIAYTFLKFSIIKIFRWNNFHFYYLERISPMVQINLDKNSDINFGKKVRIHNYTRITAYRGGNLKIGDNTALNRNCGLYCFKNINIGCNCVFGPNVLIYDHDHDFRCEGGISEDNYVLDDVVIGDNVWLGANVVILKGTKIGNNCVVGAGSVIHGEFPDNSVVVQKRDATVKRINMSTVK